MTETLSHEYLDDFQKSLHPCALEESSLSNGRAKIQFKLTDFNLILLMQGLGNVAKTPKNTNFKNKEFQVSWFVFFEKNL